MSNMHCNHSLSRSEQVKFSQIKGPLILLMKSSYFVTSNTAQHVKTFKLDVLCGSGGGSPKFAKITLIMSLGSSQLGLETLTN